MTNLSITATNHATSHVLELAGELDMASAEQLKEMLRNLTLHQNQQLIIDMTGLDFCDSSGMTALIAARTRALSADAGIALTGLPSHLAQALRVVGLDQLFPIHTTTSDAIAAWDAATGRTEQPRTGPSADRR